MDLRQLKYFVVTVELRSFARAAEHLHISQPALSKSISRLEENLGVQLLDRLPRGVTPTLHGKALAAHARLITNRVSQAADDMVALREGRKGRVVVGAGASMRIELLPEAVVRLNATHPDVEVLMVGELYEDLLPDLIKGELDLSISMLPKERTEAEIEQIPLYMDMTHPTVRVGHPLALAQNINVSDLLGYEWILSSADNLGRTHLDAYFRSMGLPIPQPGIETNSTMFALNVIRKSNHIGMHPTQVIGDAEQTGLVALPLEQITFTRTVGVSYQRESVLSPAAQLLIESLRKVSTDMIGNGVVMPLPVTNNMRIQ